MDSGFLIQRTLSWGVRYFHISSLPAWKITFLISKEFRFLCKMFLCFVQWGIRVVWGPIVFSYKIDFAPVEISFVCYWKESPEVLLTIFNIFDFSSFFLSVLRTSLTPLIIRHFWGVLLFVLGSCFEISFIKSYMLNCWQFQYLCTDVCYICTDVCYICTDECVTFVLICVIYLYWWVLK